MSWITDEAARAKEIDDEKAARDRVYNEQAPGLWNGLRHFISEAVIEINNNEYLVKHRLGGEKLRYQDASYEVRIEKITYPAMYLTVRRQDRAIEIEQKFVTNGQNRQTKTTNQVFEIDMDSQYNLFLKNKEGESFGVADASQILLLPLLRANE